MRKTESTKIVKGYNRCTRFENGIIKDGIMFEVVIDDEDVLVEYEIIKNGNFVTRKTIASTKTTKTIYELSNVTKKIANSIISLIFENKITYDLISFFQVHKSANVIAAKAASLAMANSTATLSAYSTVWEAAYLTARDAAQKAQIDKLLEVFESKEND